MSAHTWKNTLTITPNKKHPNGNNRHQTPLWKKTSCPEQRHVVAHCCHSACSPSSTSSTSDSSSLFVHEIVRFTISCVCDVAVARLFVQIFSLDSSDKSCALCASSRRDPTSSLAQAPSVSCQRGVCSIIGRNSLHKCGPQGFLLHCWRPHRCCCSPPAYPCTKVFLTRRHSTASSRLCLVLHLSASSDSV